MQRAYSYHNGVQSSNPGAGKHGYNQLQDHWHVDGNSVAFFHACGGKISMVFLKMNRSHAKRTGYRKKLMILNQHLYAHNKASAGVRAEPTLDFAFQALWLL